MKVKQISINWAARTMAIVYDLFGENVFVCFVTSPDQAAKSAKSFVGRKAASEPDFKKMLEAAVGR